MRLRIFASDMKGARPFVSDSEIHAFLSAITGRFAIRNRAVAILGLKCGSRITELLSLRVADVYRDGRFLDRVCFRRRTRKGKVEGHSLPLHRAVRMPLGRWLVTIRRANHGCLDPHAPLFPSRKGAKAIGRKSYWSIMTNAARRACIPAVATHSMRKTVARRTYQSSGHCLLVTGRVLGHRSVVTTAAYLGYGLDEDADRAVLSL